MVVVVIIIMDYILGAHDFSAGPKCFISVVLFNSHVSLSYFTPYSLHEETDLERVRSLPKVTQPNPGSLTPSPDSSALY